MLIKSADDKSPRLEMLEVLIRQSTLVPAQRRWVRDELMRLRKGIQGEREAAHYLENYFKYGQNHILMHDLRFVVDGDTAQIDHLILNRLGLVYLIETKNYAGNLLINEHGEFTVEYDRERFGIPSPIEQSRRHERILVKLLNRLELNTRVGELAFHHVVLLHPKAIIVRPPAKAFDSSMVIKADQFPTWHKNFAEQKVGFGTFLKGVVNLRSLDTLKDWSERLMRQHRPADLMALPDFIESRPGSAPNESVQVTLAPALGGIPSVKVHPAVEQVEKSATLPIQEAVHPLAKKLICVTCGVKISYAEGKFCWSNSKRFGGLQYCREHQAALA